jgi:DNA-binding NtrC family response regulator
METTKRAIDFEQHAFDRAYFKNLSDESNKTYRLYDDFVIGRDMGNDIILHDNFVSRRHALLRNKNNQFFLIDLDSQNGVFVNGVRIKEIQLQEGDQVLIGQTSFLFTSKASDPRNVVKLTSKNILWNKQLEKVPLFAKSDENVLLQGESGVGKEVISKYIHENSLRATGNFVSINCSNFNQSLVESDLFGHKKGSFTDAKEERKGAFQQADGGTLLLDEIGDMPLDLQAKLLRALENREIRPLGSDETIKVNVRIIAASHKDLQELIAQGLFRPDLYYRLNVIKLHIPALRERMEDFQGLLLNFAKELRVHFLQTCVIHLQNYSWPGNIRELKNFVRRAAALFPHESIGIEHLPQLLESIHVDFDLEKKGKKLPPVKKMEMKLIRDALIQCNGNQRQAARKLGMPKSTLHDKVKRYSIDVNTLLKQN